MMDLNEILRGIGDQMSKATPAWSSTPSFGSSQQQASAPSLGGPFANYASQMSTPFPQTPSIYSPFPQTPQDYTPFPQQPQSYTPFPDFGQAAGNQQTPFPNFGSISGGHGGTQGSVSGAGTASQDPNEIEQYIRQAAASRHINPDVAVNKVWANEGKGSYIGDQGSSFGPFQLHYGNVAGGGNAVGGLGDAFTKDTGLDARDPSTWKAQVDWSLNYAAKNGWGPWHGHQGDPMEGVGTYTPPQTLSVNEVGTPKTDPHGGRPTQFDPQLTPAEQLAACGPAAAVGMAAAFGKDYTVRQALDQAKQHGWWNGEMQGPGSEVSLLQSMGVPAQQEGVDWSRATQLVQQGKPVLVDTPGHYYSLDGYDPHTGAFHVGTSGTDLKGGSEWMTSNQINAMPQSHGPARSLITAGG